VVQHLLTHGPQSVERHVSLFGALDQLPRHALSAFMVSAMRQASEDFLQRNFHVQGSASVNFLHRRSNRVISEGSAKIHAPNAASIQRRSRLAIRWCYAARPEGRQGWP
jgi:hypothetical protein